MNAPLRANVEQSKFLYSKMLAFKKYNSQDLPFIDGHNLFDRPVGPKKLSKQLQAAAAFIHSQGFFYVDWHPGNILYDTRAKKIVVRFLFDEVKTI